MLFPNGLKSCIIKNANTDYSEITHIAWYQSSRKQSYIQSQHEYNAKHTIIVPNCQVMGLFVLGVQAWRHVKHFGHDEYCF